ncbi:hypothetical protein PR003_g19786 [Phytophthora rubi]|uniref:Uncharacterized protein n=1 Tax=Phytophthora rubi TaxID=129364 RepID=A0A6A3K0M1_9STRA|nr:hypothetical protein PR001_g18611 [Phytophthora rubi]KAE9039713.1 hypothetical protein PR002_g5339 [Phytophthora rubi]KAE9312347.1 hypothetical protein PR003_g19786 [Phytophthora rubi]
MAPGWVLRDKTAKPAPVYREMGRGHSSDGDFVVDQAAPDVDDSPDQAPPTEEDANARYNCNLQESLMFKRVPRKEGCQPCDRHVEEPTPDTPKTPPTTKLDKPTPTPPAPPLPDADADPKPDKPTPTPTQAQEPKPDQPTPKPPAPTLTPTPKTDKPTPKPDTPKIPPAVTPGTSESKPTKCHGAPDPKQAPMQEPTMPPVQNPKKATTPIQKPSHTSAKRASQS